MKRNIFGITLIILVVLLVTSSSVLRAQTDAAAEKQKAVLVTGASTGIGRKITEVLAANGHFVFAGARKQKDLDALDEIENVKAVRLDVTVQEEIDAAVELVRESGKGLYGLVNNAGVFIGGPLIEVDIDELKWLLDVNVLGPYRVTQAFAPMIIEEKGRITTIGSISGILSRPFSGQYSMSKHAIEAYTDSLAGEMGRFDVKVSVVEPGNYHSEIGNSAMQRMRDKDYAQEGSPYAEDLKLMMERPSDRSQFKEPDEVAEAVLHALFDASPKRRYLVVPNQDEAGWTIGKAIEEMVQLNEGQPYSYSREQLIEMLDGALATNKE